MTPLEILAFTAGQNAARFPAAKCVVIFVEPDPPVTPMPPFAVCETLRAFQFEYKFEHRVGTAVAFAFSTTLTAAQRTEIESKFDKHTHTPTWIDLG